MKKAELDQKLTNLESRINAFGDVGTKASEIDGYAVRAKEDATETSRIRDEINVIRQEIEKDNETITEITNNASAEQEVISVQTEENKKLTEQLEELIKKVEGLTVEAENQLGSISAQVLSVAFENVSNKLEKSVNWWRRAVLIATLLLATAALLVVLWELSLGKGDVSFTNSQFLLKLTLTSPFVFLVIFTARQYSREKKLFDEYTFKAAVSLSFEAFRKLIKLEDSAEGDHAAIVQFMINSITSIYSSPMDNITKNKDEDEDVAIAALNPPSLPSVKPKV